ncbi:MAG: M55 family metallopeptidase [Deltaproteobacteria bacterium]|nr:M55 family metallopeptidase [Deltaproteobacteria bacterium]
MKVFISVDMEGISGVTQRADTDPGQEGYERFRRIMTADVNAAVEGAFAGGAKEVVVNDSHYHMNNVIIEDLDPRAQLISGFNKHLTMMEGLDDSFIGAFLVGYHAMSGTADAVLAHTLLGREVDNTRLNGQAIGELGISAALAGCFNVPVVLATGDDKLCAEAVNQLGEVETAAVKEGIDRYTAKCLQPKEAQRRIKAAAEGAIKRIKDFKPYCPAGPFTFEVQWHSTSEAKMASLIPTVELVDSRTTTVANDDLLSAFKAFAAMLMLGWTASDPLMG